MSELNVPRADADAIKAIDSNELGRLIDQCVQDEQATAVRTLGLSSCGSYISFKLRTFEKALASHANAKAAKKRAETEYDLHKAGRDLEHAVHEMKARVAIEEQEAQLFFVDDHVTPPAFIGQHLSVMVSFRWRQSIETDWTYGRVTFLHDAVYRPNYLAPAPKRKPSSAKQNRDKEEYLYQQWEYLKSLGLQAVREYFRTGGSGAEIPVQVQAKTESNSRALNNFSATFW